MSDHRMKHTPQTRPLAGSRSMLLTAVLLLTACAISVVGLRQVRSHLRIVLQDTMGTVLETTTTALSDWTRRWVDVCFSFADRPDVREHLETLLAAPRTADAIANSDALRALRTVAQPWLDRHGGLGIFMIAPDGVSVASMRDANLGTQNLLNDHGDCLQRLFEGEPQLVLPLRSDVPLPDARGISADDQPTMFVGVPVIEADGSVSAAFTVRLDPSKDFSRIVQIARSGESGDSYAFDGDARLLSEVRFTEQLADVGIVRPGERTVLSLTLRDPGGNMLDGYRPSSQRVDLPLTKLAASAVSGVSGNDVVGYRDYRGVPVVGMWSWSDEYDFGLGYEIDRWEAYQPYYDVRRIVVLWFVVATGLFIGFSMVHVRRHRQLELLVRERIRMGEELSTHRDRLQELVDERTRELDRANRQLTDDLDRLNVADSRLRLSQRRSEILYELSQMLEYPAQEIKDFALEAALEITNSKIGYLYFMNDDETVLTLHAWSKQVMKECAVLEKQVVYKVADTGLWGEAARQRRPVITNDYEAANPLKRGTPEGHVRVIRHMNVPVIDDGKIVLIAGVGNKEGLYDESDTKQLELVMSEMWRIIQKQEADSRVREAEAAREASRKQLQRQLRWMTVRSSISSAIAKRTDARSICRIALKYLHETFLFDAGVVGFADESDAGLVVTSVYPEDQSKLAVCEGEIVAIDAASLGELKLQARVHGVSEIGTNGVSALANAFAVEIGTVVCTLPVGFGGKISAVIMLTFASREELDEHETRYLEGIAEDIGVALHNENLYHELESSYRDLKFAQGKLLEQERLSAMGQMASGIAHDINNTLAPITLYTEALLDGGTPLDDRSTRFLCTIKDAAKDIEQTIGRLRQFYRKPERRETEWRCIEVSQLFDQVTELTRPRWMDVPMKSGVSVTIRQEPPACHRTLMGIESELREALMNLIINAVDAMPEGGSIVLRCTGSNGRTVLEVEDTGHGMSDELKHRCLDPFFTTKGERGTGLGLSTAFGAMERHGGEIEIDSEIGRGTIVRLIFPPDTASADDDRGDEPTADLPELKILCIDDDQRVRDGLVEILQMAGHEAYGASGGQAGIEEFREAKESGQAFDVAITDLGMPDMDGWEVADTLKQISPDTPVLLLSGWGSLMDGDETASTSVDGILGKPPNATEIKKALREALRKKGGGCDGE